MRPLARTGLRLSVAALVLIGLARPVNAEWHFVPFVGYTFKGSTTLFDPERGSSERHGSYGLAVVLLGEGPFGVEGYFVRTPNFFENDEIFCPIETCVDTANSYALMGNAVLTTPRGWNRYGLRPYVSGGAGLMRVAQRSALPTQPIPIDLNLTGMNIGGGATGLFSDTFGVRFDLRYFRKVEGPDETELETPVSFGPIRLRYWTASFGLVIKY